ncbi:MAG: DUF3431 domain-containing protein [Patescibacteria group bacterium]
MKIKNNFLIVSNYNNDISWVSEYTNNYLIYNKSEDAKIPVNIDPKKIIKSENVGYNFYDYFTFIIDNYDNLPENIIFAKGNIFPRHVTQSYFEKVINNEYFTTIEDYKAYTPKFPISFISSDGGFNEINNSWYLKHFETRYFNNYNDFLKFIYKNPFIPKYIRFAPGGNYIVPKNQILKLPKIVYENMKLLISYCQLPGETHIIERAIYTLWNSNFELNPDILKPFNANSINVKKLNRNIFNEIFSHITFKLINLLSKRI